MSREVKFATSSIPVARILLWDLPMPAVSVLIAWQNIHGHLLYLMAGLAGCGMFGSTLLRRLRQTLRRPCSLTLKEQGLHDNTSAAVGLIAWNDILSLNPGTIGRQPFITIFVHNPGYYLERLSTAGQKQAQARCRLTGSPVNIPVGHLNASTDIILQTIESFLNQSLPAKPAGDHHSAS